jgi:hypothetical protein
MKFSLHKSCKSKTLTGILIKKGTLLELHAQIKAVCR